METLSNHLRKISLVSADLGSTADALISVMRRFGPPARTELRTWREAKQFLLPMKTFPTHYIVFRVAPSWTGILSDMHDSDESVDALAVTRTLGCGAISGTFRDDVRFLTMAERGKEFRSVIANLDGEEWQYAERGERTEWEEDARRSSAPPRERLTPEMVLGTLRRRTQVALPVDWRALKGIVGIERSTAKVVVPIRAVALEDDV